MATPFLLGFPFVTISGRHLLFSCYALKSKTAKDQSRRSFSATTNGINNSSKSVRMGDMIFSYKKLRFPFEGRGRLGADQNFLRERFIPFLEKEVVEAEMGIINVVMELRTRTAQCDLYNLLLPVTLP